MQSKHAWSKVTSDVTWDGIKGLIGAAMQHGQTTLINQQGTTMIYEAVNGRVVVRYAIVNDVIRIADAWVK